MFVLLPAETLPDDYVPYMEWKSNVGAYQWIGAGRDSDHRLSVLCSIWLERGADRGGPSTTVAVTATTTTTATTITTTSNATTQVVIAPEPPPRGPAVRPTSPRKRELFRLQVTTETLHFKDFTTSISYSSYDSFIFFCRKNSVTKFLKKLSLTMLVELKVQLDLYGQCRLVT